MLRAERLPSTSKRAMSPQRTACRKSSPQSARNATAAVVRSSDGRRRREGGRNAEREFEGGCPEGRCFALGRVRRSARQGAGERKQAREKGRVHRRHRVLGG